MPSKSAKQRRLMQAACNDPKVRKKTGIPKNVACKYAREDAKKPRRRRSGRA